ncbi:MAG: crossover junction endodeoxyribonuclease RuvC [Bdellovibrionales bacterium]|nr:crossover junction endodeoxyribonuclease RuvC [Bdellovibrionales bacterium]
MTIIGIDPGSRLTGFGVIEKSGYQFRYLDHGVISIPLQLTFAERLAYLAKMLRPLWSKYPQSVTVVEKVFLGKNVDSAFKLGHARGVCLLVAAEHGSPVFEYASRSVKKSLTGNGGASKDQVQLMVQQFLQTKIQGLHDGTDALALAICHFYEWEKQAIIQRLGRVPHSYP